MDLGKKMLGKRHVMGEVHDGGKSADGSEGVSEGIETVQVEGTFPVSPGGIVKRMS